MPQDRLFKKIYFWPSKHISLVIPLVLIISFIVGLNVDTKPLKQYIPLISILMIYPTMIGFKPKEILNLEHGKLLSTSLLVNFIVVPLLAYLLGISFLLDNPQLFAGLAIISLLPTSNMTIAFTMFAKGNVPGAIKLTTTSLLLGALLAPWYLLVMVGKYVPIDILATVKTISLIILLPLTMGIITYSLLMRKYTVDEFKKNIKPYLPATSSWGMVLIIFTSISINAPRIASNLDIFVSAFLVMITFYISLYAIAILIGRNFFNKENGLPFVFSTALRNLSISIGLAATAFGSNAALMVSLAFLIQQQAGAGFIKLNEKYGFLSKKELKESPTVSN